MKTPISDKVVENRSFFSIVLIFISSQLARPAYLNIIGVLGFSDSSEFLPAVLFYFY
ncbi:MAG TPA: hypothetical protein VI413_06295 [Paludibacter sp.]